MGKCLADEIYSSIIWLIENRPISHQRAIRRLLHHLRDNGYGEVADDVRRRYYVEQV